jgi:hypothetical protein
MYDIIGNVVDEQNAPLIGVIVDDGVEKVSTDKFGGYALKSSKKSLNFNLNGYQTQTFDLTKYKDGSSVNVDIKMIKSPVVDPQAKSQTSTKPNKVLIWSLVGVGVALVSFVIYKIAKKGK